MTRVRFLLLALVLAFSPSAFAQDAAPKTTGGEPGAAKAAVKTTITLSIALADDCELTYSALPFKEGMTVADLLASAAKHKRPLQFKSKGSGEFAFLTELEGVKNAGASGKNWTFKVDGQRAKVGMGSMKLKAGSHVLWLLEG